MEMGIKGRERTDERAPGIIPGSLYAFSRLNRSIMHSRLVRSKKQLRRDVFVTFVINIQYEGMIRLFRLLASYYDRNLAGIKFSWGY